ncbi:MAG: cation:proton antiporter [Armatimonadota bacterium]
MSFPLGPRRRGALWLFALLLTLLSAWLPAGAQPDPGAPPQAAHAAAPDSPTRTPPAGHRALTSDPSHGVQAEDESAGHGGQINQLLLALILILIGAKLGGELFERIGQPAVLGEILVGMLLGNLGQVGFHGLDFLRTNEAILALSELGVILLLFEVGLESNVQEMRRVGVSSLLVATLGVVAPGLLGWGAARLFLPQESVWTHVFIGATLCATSVGITARVLKDLGQLHRPESKIVLGAAVLDDVMGLVVLAVVQGLIRAAAGGGALAPFDIGLIVVKALAFLVGAIVIGGFLSPHLFRFASYLNVRHMLLVTSLGFCFLLARLASAIELAPIVGAFAAGLILDPVHYQDFRDRGEHSLEELIHPISGFLVPVFFVVTGTHVDLRAAANPGVLGFAAVLTVVAVLGKQLCALGVVERGLNRLAVGLGMIPRGEVGLIFANIGLSLQVLAADGTMRPVVSPSVFSAVVIVVMVTTLVTPPLLKWSMTSGKPTPGPAA